LVENPAKRRDLNSQIVVFDHRFRPDGVHDLVEIIGEDTGRR
jgi:hypothetical protein